MPSGLISSDAALNVARDIIGEQVTVERHPVGFGNENWMIRTADKTCRWVLKVADLSSELKWRSSHVALELARSVGVPVPELVHSGRQDQLLVRVFTWIHGRSPIDVIVSDAQRDSFVRSTAEAIRSLHTIDTKAFSSRLDGSAPRFEQWSRGPTAITGGGRSTAGVRRGA